MNNNLLKKERGFFAFLADCYPQYIIDDNSYRVLELLHYYSVGAAAFVERGYSLEKGICLAGPVGTGKTVILELFSYYLNAIGHNLKYNRDVVWNLADRYQASGVEVFNRHRGKHCFYDELALTDEIKKFPVQEEVNNYGNKILVGEKLIRHRYLEFEQGILTHFTTNATMEDMTLFYGGRSMSRFRMMCNVIYYTGEDRRLKGNVVRFQPPVFMPKPVVEPVAEQSEEDKMREMLEGMYQGYLDGSIPELNWSHYLFFKRYGGKEMFPETSIETVIMDSVRTDRKDYVLNFKSPANKKESRRMVELKEQWEAGKIDDDERLYLSRTAYKRAMIMYMEIRKRSGKEMLFDK